MKFTSFDTLQEGESGDVGGVVSAQVDAWLIVVVVLLVGWWSAYRE